LSGGVACGDMAINPSSTVGVREGAKSSAEKYIGNWRGRWGMLVQSKTGLSSSGQKKEKLGTGRW